MSFADRPRLVELSRPECYALLRAHQYGIGRLAWGGDYPTILPVNYVLDGGDIVVRTGAGEIMTVATARSRVAFEVDPLGAGQVAADTPAWSVMARGIARVVDEADERTFLGLVRLEPSAGGFKPNYVRIVVTDLTGRRLED